MSVRMRHTRSHTRNRRSHHALSEPRLSVCSCGAKHVRHQVCESCGMYRGRQVIDVKAREEKLAKRTERKLKAMGEDPTAARAEDSAESSETPEKLDPEKLAQK